MLGKLTTADKMEFEIFVKENMRRAYYVALGFLGSHDLAMEASQKAFIRAYKHFKKFDRSKKFFTWYYKILRNLCLNMIRDNKRKSSLDILECKNIDAENNNVENIIEEKELRKNISKALNMLQTEDREVIILREFENYSYKEIAEFLEIPEGTVMSKLFYARKKLAKKLESLIK